MSVHREEYLDLCAALALGALDDPDSSGLEQHLAEGCSECEAELKRLADAAVLLAAAAPPVAPPPALKVRVLERVRAEGARAPSRAEADATRVIPMRPRRQASISTWGWAAAAAVLAVTSIVTWRASERLRGELVSAQQQLEAQRQQLAEKQQQLDEAQRWSALLEGEGTRVVDLQLTPQGSAILRARAVYDPRTHRAVIVFTNFTPPSGADYQLWALRGGHPESLGLIRSDATGRAVVKLPDLGDATGLDAFAVSLEKTGGSTSPAGPEGPVVMVGKLGGS